MPKPDGTLPVGARCPKDRGGCGKMRKVPRAALTAATPPPAAGAWDPPSEPRQAYPAGQRCPHCGDANVYAEPRGTMRVCLSCHTRVTPPGVLSPYERGTQVTRAARSQRERDLEALGLAERKGVMLAQLAELAGSGKLDPASMMKTEWFTDQVKNAASGTRLDELADLFKEAGIRRRRWWHQQPALPAGYAGQDPDDEYQDQEQEHGEDPEDEPGTAMTPSAPASIAAQQHRAQPRPMTWAEAFAVLGWRLTPADGGCQVIDYRGHCAADYGANPPVTDGRVAHGWVCRAHYDTLVAVITSHNRKIAS